MSETLQLTAPDTYLLLQEEASKVPVVLRENGMKTPFHPKDIKPGAVERMFSGQQLVVVQWFLDASKRKNGWVGVSCRLLFAELRKSMGILVAGQVVQELINTGWLRLFGPMTVMRVLTGRNVSEVVFVTVKLIRFLSEHQDQHLP